MRYECRSQGPVPTAIGSSAASRQPNSRRAAGRHPAPAIHTITSAGAVLVPVRRLVHAAADTPMESEEAQCLNSFRLDSIGPA